MRKNGGMSPQTCSRVNSFMVTIYPDVSEILKTNNKILIHYIGTLKLLRLYYGWFSVQQLILTSKNSTILSNRICNIHIFSLLTRESKASKLFVTPFISSIYYGSPYNRSHYSNASFSRSATSLKLILSTYYIIWI